MSGAAKFGVALLAGTAITLSTLLSGAFAHATAIYGHAGEGTLVYLVRRLTWTAIGAVIIGTGTVLFMMLLDDPALRLTMINLVGSVEIVILVVLQSVTIGEVYNFGSWNGCGALFVGGVAISAIATAIGLVAVWVIH